MRTAKPSFLYMVVNVVSKLYNSLAQVQHNTHMCPKVKKLAFGFSSELAARFFGVSASMGVLCVSFRAGVATHGEAGPSTCSWQAQGQAHWEMHCRTLKNLSCLCLKQSFAQTAPVLLLLKHQPQVVKVQKWNRLGKSLCQKT